MSLNDLEGVMKIYKALTLPCITRLHKTWSVSDLGTSFEKNQSLSPEEKVTWNSMDTVMNPDTGHAVYRNLVKTASGCLVPCFCLFFALPFLNRSDVLLEDIESLENSFLQRADGLMDLKQMQDLAKLLDSFKQFQVCLMNLI